MVALIKCVPRPLSETSFKGLATDSGQIGWFALVNEGELQVIVAGFAVQLNLLVITILVSMSNDVGQGLVNSQSDLATRVLRQTVDQSELAHSSADDTQKARIARHHNSQMKTHLASAEKCCSTGHFSGRFSTTAVYLTNFVVSESEFDAPPQQVLSMLHTVASTGAMSDSPLIHANGLARERNWHN